MPLIFRVDNEIQDIHKKDLEKSKDDSKFKMCVTKPPSYQTQSAPAPNTTDIPTDMPLPITTYVLPEFVPQGTSVGLGSTQFIGGVGFAEYRFTQKNFAKSIKT